MIPKIRLRGPKLSNNRVTVSSEYYLQSNNSHAQKLNVSIRLPPYILKEISYPFANDDEESKDDVMNDNDQNTNNEKEKEKEEETDSEDSDLSSLDFEINKALSSAATESSINSVKPSSATIEAGSAQEIKIEDNVTPATKTINYGSSKTLAPIYKAIPSNILPIIEKELNALNSDEDFGIIDKIIFSLKDPLSACKIRLPVKSSYCVHFECFDYETFCIFNKIPPGIKMFTRKELTRKSFEKLAYHRKSQFYNSPIRFLSVPEITNPKIGRKHTQSKLPLYKCPICDIKFLLSELCISESFNYFVKSAPRETERIELVDMSKYRIIDDSIRHKSNSKKVEEEIIVLTDDDDDDADRINDEPTIIDSTDEVFNDGLDDELIRLSNNGGNMIGKYKGAGSWDDPLTLD